MSVPESLSLLDPCVWLDVTFSERSDPLDRQHCLIRFRSFLAGSGLLPMTSSASARIGVGHLNGGCVTPLDRALAVAWLINQPEVVLVHRKRERRADHGQA
jgi:hypothetical protein